MEARGIADRDETKSDAGRRAQAAARFSGSARNSKVSSMTCAANARQQPQPAATPRRALTSQTLEAPLQTSSRICCSVTPLQRHTYTSMSPRQKRSLNHNENDCQQRSGSSAYLFGGSHSGRGCRVRSRRTIHASGLDTAAAPFQRLHQATRRAAASQNRNAFLLSRLPERFHHVMTEKISKQNKKLSPFWQCAHAPLSRRGTPVDVA